MTLPGVLHWDRLHFSGPLSVQQDVLYLKIHLLKQMYRMKLISNVCETQQVYLCSTIVTLGERLIVTRSRIQVPYRKHGLTLGHPSREPRWVVLRMGHGEQVNHKFVCSDFYDCKEKASTRMTHLNQGMPRSVFFPMTPQPCRIMSAFLNEV